MSHDPTLVLVLFAVLGSLSLVTLIVLGAVWARLRSFSLAETRRLLEELTRRQRTIETLLTRLAADRDPGQPASRSPNTDVAAGSVPVPVPVPVPAVSIAVRPSPSPSPTHRPDPAASGAAGGQTLIAVPSLMTGPPTGAADASASVAADLGQRFGAIWALADAGESAESIARTTGQPIGQVELILGLRRQMTGPRTNGETRPR